MRVLHSGTLDMRYGGPASSVGLTLRGLCAAGVEAEMVMPRLGRGGVLMESGAPVHYTEAPWERRLGYSPRLRERISSLGEYNIYHIQGVWQYLGYVVADVARQKEKPYVISPRGMLYPQDIAKSNALLKRISLKLRLLRDLNGAGCVHATCREEMGHCRDLGVTAPIAVIPNPVEVKRTGCQKEDGVFRVGYLGRLSRRKSVELLIYSFRELGEKVRDAELVVIGGGEGEYERFLKSEVRRLGLSNVRFMGFLTGEEKERAISSCSVLAMPSEFENFGNVVAEGLSLGVPCIATKGAPWGELEISGCGWWVERGQAGITGAVEAALSLSGAELRAMGERGREMVRRNYSVESVAERMKRMYEWLSGRGEMPDFVWTYGGGGRE